MPLGNPMGCNHTTGAGVRSAAHMLRRVQHPGGTRSADLVQKVGGLQQAGGSRWEPRPADGRRLSGSCLFRRGQLLLQVGSG